MAPVVRQDTMDVLDEVLAMEELNFDEITSLATSVDLYDDSKLVMDYGVDVARLQTSSPAPTPLQALSVHQQDYFTSSDSLPASPEFLTVPAATPEPLMQQALSPGPCIIQAQAFSPLPQTQVDGQSYVMSQDSQYLVLQPATIEPIVQQTLSPVQQALSPEPSYIQLQPVSHQLDLDDLDLSLLTPPPSADSPADSQTSSMSPWHQDQEEEEAALPATQQAANAPKKRGRKRMYPEGMAPSRRRPKKTKIYEMGPLPDEEQEKKRRNAVNAKRHRDLQKQEKKKLAESLAEATAERDRLLELVNRYKEREQHLIQVLNVNGIKTVGLLHTTLEGL